MIWVLLALVVALGLWLGVRWLDRVPPASAAEMSLKAERDAGLVFYGAALLPGYWEYIQESGFYCYACKCNSYTPTRRGTRICAWCGAVTRRRWRVGGFIVGLDNEAPERLARHVGAAPTPSRDPSLVWHPGWPRVIC